MENHIAKKNKDKQFQRFLNDSFTLHSLLVGKSCLNTSIISSDLMLEQTHNSSNINMHTKPKNITENFQKHLSKYNESHSI